MRIKTSRIETETNRYPTTYVSLFYLCAPVLKCGIFAAISIFIITASPSFAESEITELQKGKKELSGIRTEIKEKKKGLAAAGKKEKGLLAEIEKIENRLKKLETEESRMDREIIILEKRLHEKTAKTSSLESEMERKKKLLYKRLAFLYKSGDTGYLQLLLSSGDISDSARNYRYMVRVAAHDRQLIRSYGMDMASLSVQMGEIRSDKEKFVGLEKELAKKRVEIKREREERDDLLSEVRREKRQYKESINELEANARSLQQLLARLDRHASSASKGSPNERIKGYQPSDFENQRGLLDFPVKGDVVGFFGKEIDKDSKTAVYRKGIEISAKTASQIRAVYNGRVIYAGQFKGYGLMVIIDHGGGFYTLYAHASKLMKKVNDEINKGDIIGEVGESGRTGEPSLYFEVRRGGRPENPMEWLKS